MKELIESGNKTISLKLTKKRKRGRPSNKDKEMFNRTFYFELPEENIIENLQKQADSVDLPIKFVGYERN